MTKEDLISRILVAKTEAEANLLAEWIIDQQQERLVDILGKIKECNHNSEKEIIKYFFKKL